jgi:LacI family transcriptional regulator
MREVRTLGRPRVTLRDVAKQVGVHPSTVSRVLNPHTRGMVTAAIAKRVTEAAERLGYAPNPFALSLKTNRSFLVGVLVPDLVNPIFPPIIRGIEAVLEAAGYTAIVANSDNQDERERQILAKMKARQVDGLILATAHRDDALIAQCLAEGSPLVLINRTIEGLPVHAVVNEDKQGMRLAVEHVTALGHTRIAHLAGPLGISTGQRRLEGFREAMKATGLKVDRRFIAECAAFTEEEGLRAARALLKGHTPFTAIVAANDRLALGAYDALAERGWRCPEDVSITGFNDMPLVERVYPPLTTVRIPLYEMGAQAARMLLEQLESAPIQPRTVMLQPTLVVRGSTGPPKALVK